MELDITKLIKDRDYIEAYQPCVGSVASHGCNAASMTWRNALKTGEKYKLITEDQIEECKDHFRAYGAWEKEEIEAWDLATVNAMLIQEALTPFWEFRNLSARKMWEAIEDQGRVFRCKRKVYLYIGM